MTFEDIGVAVCNCGVERRLYKPTLGPAGCWPCIQRRFTHQLAELDDGRRHVTNSPVTIAVRARRQRLEAQGLCIDCGRMPKMGSVKRCMSCHQKSQAGKRRVA